MIAKAARDLPQNMPAPPSYQKVNPADSPILYMAVSSPTMRLSDVDEYAETTIAQKISTVSGVAQVSVFGAQKYAVRVQVDPRKLASAQIGIDEVSNAVQKGNVNLPTGTLWGSKQAFTVQANGQLMKADQYRPLIVAYRNGKPIRLEQVANVFDSVENDKNAAWFAGRGSQAQSCHGAGCAASTWDQHGGSGGQHSQIVALLPPANARGGEPRHHV